MCDLQWWSQHLNLANPILSYHKMGKYLNKLIMFIDYVPLIGPMYNATHALNLLLLFRSDGKDSADDNDDDITIAKEKSRRVREKGLTAVVTAFIDIFTICLAVGVIAFVCDCLARIQTFAFVRQVLILFILINVWALTTGAKIITRQLVINLTRQLEDVNHVGTSMVRSVTITTSFIERIVATTESKIIVVIEYYQYYWQRCCYWSMMIITFPQYFTFYVYHKTKMTITKIILYIKVSLRIKLFWLLNLITFGLIGWIRNYPKSIKFIKSP